jgi:hypothetical protein
MGIEQDAQQDLALTDEDAENIAGGKKAKKVSHTATKHPAGAASHSVSYIQAPAATGGSVDDTGTTAWTDDCDDPAPV